MLGCMCVCLGGGGGGVVCFCFLSNLNLIFLGVRGGVGVGECFDNLAKNPKLRFFCGVEGRLGVYEFVLTKNPNLKK